MDQFDIFKHGQNGVSFLINLQSNPMDSLSTRFVAPVRRENDYPGQTISRIHIPIVIDGTNYIIFISELAAVSSNLLGEKVGNAKVLRQEIIAAVDLLFTGF
ncbi:MAG: CcdB family protein [Spirochaetales bacterium]|nr:CcdB family protein [Spirochaetales bacterium]